LQAAAARQFQRQLTRTVSPQAEGPAIGCWACNDLGAVDDVHPRTDVSKLQQSRVNQWVGEVADERKLLNYAGLSKKIYENDNLNRILNMINTLKGRAPTYKFSRRKA